MNRFGKSPDNLGFGQSIGTCLKKYAVFEGRAGRSEFWTYFLVYSFGSLILDVSVESTQSPALGIVLIIVSLGGMLPMIAVGCRRMHDINKSGWFQIIPIFNLILWAMDSSEGADTIKNSQTKIFSKTRTRKLKDRDFVDDLEELEELYEDGTLSEAQFKKAKNKLLK